MKNNPKNISRRQFIQGAGGLSLALPFLPSLILPKDARASGPTIPKRFVSFCTKNGYMYPVYYPKIEADHSFASDVFYKPFSEFTGDISEVLNSNYEPYKNKMNLYRGLDIAGSNDHDPTHMLCSMGKISNEIQMPTGTGASIDVLMAKSPNFYQSPPAFSAIRAQDGIYDYSMSFDRSADGSVIRVPYMNSPTAIFQQVFGGRIIDPTVAAQFKAKKITIGDLVLEKFNALKNNRRIDSADKHTLDSFITNLHDLNLRINSSPATLSCSTPTLRSLSTNYVDGFTETDWENFYSNYIDTMVSAMACDLTRISIISMSLWGLDHPLSHSDPNDRSNQLKYLANTAHISRIVLEMVSKMNNVIEADGTTMLDNSIVFWGSEDATGTAHGCQSMPAVSFGSAGGKIKTGYYLDYRTKPFVPHPDVPSDSGLGRGYNQLLVTFMKALGLSPSDYLAFGDGGGFGLYNTAAAYSNGHYNQYQAVRNDPLPFVYIG